ncbi:MAG: hypothetical protein AAFV71_22710 [Cyanobacteria bacterium J06633_8]
MKLLFKYLVSSICQPTKIKKVIAKKKKIRKKINSSLGNIGVLLFFLIFSSSSLATKSLQSYTTNSVSGTSSSYKQPGSWYCSTECRDVAVLRLYINIGYNPKIINFISKKLN